MWRKKRDEVQVEMSPHFLCADHGLADILYRRFNFLTVGCAAITCCYSGSGSIIMGDPDRSCSTLMLDINPCLNYSPRELAGFDRPPPRPVPATPLCPPRHNGKAPLSVEEVRNETSSTS